MLVKLLLIKNVATLSTCCVICVVTGLSDRLPFKQTRSDCDGDRS